MLLLEQDGLPQIETLVSCVSGTSSGVVSEVDAFLHCPPLSGFAVLTSLTAAMSVTQNVSKKNQEYRESQYKTLLHSFILKKKKKKNNVFHKAISNPVINVYSHIKPM